MDKIRLATIIDCEGTVGIITINEKRRKAYKRPYIQISQNIKWYVSRFKEMFGFGGVYPAGNNGWQYEAYYLHALIICLVLRKYFELKKEKANTIIHHYEEKLKGPPTRHRKRLITQMAQHSLEYRNGEWFYRAQSL